MKSEPADLLIGVLMGFGLALGAAGITWSIYQHIWIGLITWGFEILTILFVLQAAYRELKRTQQGER